MRFEAVLFDFDGTIAYSAKDVWLAIDEALAEHGLALDKSYRGDDRNLAFTIAEILSDNFGNLPDETVKQVEQGVHEIYTYKTLFPNTYMYDGIRELLERLQSEEIKLGIVTNKGKLPMERLLRVKNWQEYFPYLVAGDSCEQASTKTKRLTYMLEQLVKTKSAVYIGDSPWDVSSAKECGIASVGVLYGDGDSEKVKAERPDRVCASPAEIAEFLFDTQL